MNKKGTDFNEWLKGQLKHPGFRKAYKEEDVRARLALRIAELRRKRNLTQGQLARRLRTTQQVVSNLETFKHANVTVGTLQKLAAALNSRLVLELR